MSSTDFYSKVKFLAKKSVLATIALFAASPETVAIPARRHSTMTVDLADGTQLTAYLHGDENFHFYTTADGTVLEETPQGFRTTGLSPKAMRAKASKSPSRKLPGIVDGTTFPSTGDQKIIVVLVRYQDVDFNLDDPKDYFTRMLNEDGFSDYWATGSAREYFINSSGGLFRPEFDVYGPITLQKNREYYGGNNAWGQDNAPQKMVIEACRQLNPEVDFLQYDRDGDGYIDNVFVVYAGRGEASGGSPDCVWPHAWNLSSAEPGSQYTFNGVRLNRYACSNEWELSDQGKGFRPVGIGTFIHEFSHVMGLPDLYSTEYVKDSFTPGSWSVLDYGPYNNDGCTPPQYSAFERSVLGYISPRELTAEPANNILKPIAEGDAFLVPVPESTNEYFLLEHRDGTGWDKFTPGHGLLAWHIDYDADIWKRNAVNNDPSHNRVDLIEADGILTEATRSGDCFPGTALITSLDLQSRNGNPTGIHISDIKESYDRLLLRINGGLPDITPPQGLTVENIKAGGFTIKWEPVYGAKGYSVNITAPEDDSFNLCVYADELTTYADISGLVPSTEYNVNVIADDGLYGSVPSASINATTLDPTFDYFSPVALEATEIGQRSFTANWEEMENATEYYIDVYMIAPGDATTDIVDFAEGPASLPEGWTTTSSGSYGMASYSGKEIPALRMSADCEELISPVYNADIESLSFWHRGNSTTPSEKLVVNGLTDGKWAELLTVDIKTEKGGAITVIDDIPIHTRAISIKFSKPSGKGSVALDDVSLIWNRLMKPTQMPNYTGLPVMDTSIEITGLQPGSAYRYSLKATDGIFTSLRSNEIDIITLTEQVGINTTVISPENNVQITGRELKSEIPVDIYDISGRITASSVKSFTFPDAGIYIITHRSEKLKAVIR